jgi:hypothetical protein
MPPRAIMTATITLKVGTKEKKRLQKEARDANQSLNAYLLGKVAGAGANCKRTTEHEKLETLLDGRFAGEQLWKSMLSR